MSRYVIPDIHGGLLTFRALLRQIDLRFGDRLYLLGDFIDRGPDSKGVLDTILELLAVGHDVRPLLGNHEAMLLEMVRGTIDDYSWHWMTAWGLHTLQSFGLTNPEELPDRYLHFLEQLPCLRTDGDYVLVHAGLDMNVRDPLSQTSPQLMVWGGQSPYGSELLPGKTIITGHRIRPLAQIMASLSTGHITLDNGAYSNMQPEYGNLLALNLETRELLIQPWID